MRSANFALTFSTAVLYLSLNRLSAALTVARDQPFFPSRAAHITGESWLEPGVHARIVVRSICNMSRVIIRVSGQFCAWA